MNYMSEKYQAKMQRSEKHDKVLYLLCSKILSQHRQQTAITDTKANTICIQNLQKTKSLLFQREKFPLA